MSLNNLGIYLRSFTGFLILIVIIGISLGSCDNGNKEVEQAIKKEVIDIHDEVMPKMREIVELKEQLQTIQDNLADNNTSEDNMEKVSSLRHIQSELNDSEAAMRTWMQEFKVNLPEETPHEEIMDYYETEKQEISEVKVKMLEGIDAAKEFIEENKE